MVSYPIDFGIKVDRERNESRVITKYKDLFDSKDLTDSNIFFYVSEFPMKDDDLRFPSTSYSFYTNISACTGCSYLEYCHY